MEEKKETPAVEETKPVEETKAPEAKKESSCCGGSSTSCCSELTSAIKIPSGGAMKLMMLGLLIFIGSIGFKQFLGNVVKVKAAGCQESTLLRQERDAKGASIMQDAQELRAERANQSALLSDKDAKDSAKERIKEIDKELKDLDKENKEEIKELQEEYAEDKVDAEVDTASAQAGHTSWNQTLNSFSWILDLAKLAGCLMVIFAVFTIAADEDKYPAGTRLFAVVFGAATIIASVLSNI